jgi:hypothetical protein
MKHYKNPKTNEIFAFELNGSQDDLIHKDFVEISIEELKAIQIENNQKLFNNKKYTEKRLSEYPPISDYIDGVVKGDNEQIKAYIDACLAVKLKYPKPLA